MPSTRKQSAWVLLRHFPTPRCPTYPSHLARHLSRLVLHLILIPHSFLHIFFRVFSMAFGLGLRPFS